MKTSKPFTKMYGKPSDPLHWSKYDILWNEIIKTNRFRSRPHTRSVMQFGNFNHIHEKRLDPKNYIQQPVKHISRKNAQVLSEYIICLMCLKSGHLAHECVDYVPKAHQSNIQESSTMFLSPQMNDYRSNINMCQDDLSTTHKDGNKLLPIVLVKNLINLPSPTTKNQNQTIDNKIRTLNL